MINAKNLAITQRLLYPYRRVITTHGETGRIARRDGGPWRSHDGDIYVDFDKGESRWVDPRTLHLETFRQYLWRNRKRWAISAFVMLAVAAFFASTAGIIGALFSVGGHLSGTIIAIAMSHRSWMGPQQ